MGEQLCFLTAEIENKIIYYHEAVWVKFNGLIKPDFLICHRNGKTTENNIENLFEIEESKINGSDRPKDHKIFHQDSYNEKFVKEHFPDVYESLQKREEDKKRKAMEDLV